MKAGEDFWSMCASEFVEFVQAHRDAMKAGEDFGSMCGEFVSRAHLIDAMKAGEDFWSECVVLENFFGVCVANLFKLIATP